MWIKVLMITLLTTMFALLLVPGAVVCMLMKKFDWFEIKRIYNLWWTSDED